MAGKTPKKASAKVAKKSTAKRVAAKAVKPRKAVAKLSARNPTKTAENGLGNKQGREPTSQPPELLRRLLRAKDRMDAASHEEWPVQRLAEVSSVSEAYFSRQFKQAFGVPPHRYLLTRRIERAKALLRDSDLSITEIALEAGWDSLGTFGRTFRDITGESPSELRAREKAAPHALESVPECYIRAVHRPNLTMAVSDKRRQEEGDTMNSDAKEETHE